jgi:hypothetical protein
MVSYQAIYFQPADDQSKNTATLINSGIFPLLYVYSPLQEYLPDCCRALHLTFDL